MSYTIAENFDLPSKGLLYDKSINTVIKLKSLTTEHEMQRLNHSDRSMKVMADIIDDCMVEPCGISAYEMCVQDYQFLLHKLRTVTYGPEYKSIGTCPYCGNNNTTIVKLDEIPVVYFTPECKQYLSFELPRTKDRILLKYQTPKMIDDVIIRGKELRQQYTTYKGDFEFLSNLMLMVDLVNGEKKMDFELEKYLRQLPMADSNYILNMQDKFIQSFGLDNNINFVCEMCGLSYKSPFRITGEFYRPSI